ncbi:helix-turn-helix domain-containing protein [Inhella sp.]|uniref:helix-turn-helix domain-containing protein n=1 Tax=Inhella sp. TaxID=1921806 RepID=UPI0035ADF6D9
MSGSPQPAWQGQALLGAGLALFVGHSGDNRAHRHLAHQVCLARPGTVSQLELDEGVVQGEALWLRAGTRHRLLGHQGLLLWVDPTHALAPALLGSGPAAWGHLEPAWFARLRALALNPQAATLMALQPPVAAAPDTRLASVLALLRQALAGGDKGERQALAQACALSPDRFSHWFKAQTGMPLRSYRKWLRLLLAIEQALAGRSLIEAAHGAGFADQAHFARTLRAMLGVTASIALRGVRLL